jgi:hypothetical protein
MLHNSPKAEVGCSNHLACANPAESAARFLPMAPVRGQGTAKFHAGISR